MSTSKQVEELRRELSSSVSKLSELQRHYAAQSRECGCLREELRARTSSNEALVVEVEKWKRTDVTKEGRIADVLKQVEGLQRDLSMSTSQVTDFRSHCEVQSRELTSIRSELKSTCASNDDKDRTIVVLTAKAEEQKAASTKQVEGLQRDLSMSASQITDLQRRCDAILSSNKDKDRTTAALSAEVKELRKELSMSTSQVTELRNYCEMQSRELTSMHSELASVHSELKSTCASNDDKDHTIVVLTTKAEEQKAASTKQVEGLQRDLSMSASQITDLQYRCDAILSSNKDKDRMTATLSAEVEGLRKELSMSTSQVSELRSYCEVQSRKLASMCSELKSTCVSNDDKDRTIVVLTAKAEEQKAASTKQVEGLQRDLSMSASQITELQRRCDATLSSNIDKDRTTAALSAEVEELRERLSMSTSQVSDLRGYCEVQSRELASVRSELKSTCASNDDKDRTIVVLTAKAEEQKATSTKEVESLQRDLSMSASQIAELQRRCDAVVSSNKDKDRTSAALSAEVEELRERLSMSTSQVSDLRSYCEAQSRELASVRSELKSTCASNDDKDRTIVVLTAKAEEQKVANTKEVESLQRDLTMSASQIAELQRRCDAVVSSNKDKDRTSAALSAEVEELRERLSMSTSQVTELRSYCETQSRELTSICSELQATCASNDDKDRTIVVLTAKAEEQKATSTKEVEGLQRDLSMSASQIAELQRRCDAVVSSNKDKDRMTAALSVEVEELRERLSMSTSQVSDLRGYCEVQSRELASVRSELKSTCASNDDKDRTIVVLTAKAEEQKVANTKEVEGLQRDLTMSASQIAELQRRCEVQSHGYSLNKGNDRMIATLTSQLEELKRTDTSKEERIAVIRKQAEDLQLELTATQRKIVELRRRYGEGEYADTEIKGDASKIVRIQGIGDFERWMRESSIDNDSQDELLDPSCERCDHNLLARRALLGVRSQNWSVAYQDAKKSIDIQPSAVGYIAKVLAQIGMGEKEEAIHVFDLAFWNCHANESSLLLLIKTIMLFVAGKYDEAILRMHDLIAVPNDDETVSCCIQVLGKMYLMRGDYKHATQSLERAQALSSSNACSFLDRVSLVLGWSFEGLQVTVQRCNCEALLATGEIQEAAEALCKMLDTFDERLRKETAEWVADLKKKCVDGLEALGDSAFNAGEYEEAVLRYSSALSLNPSDPISILAKRSGARASKGFWADALADANEVIKLDPSSHQGYERRHAALHGLGNYDEAIQTILDLLSIIKNSPDEELRRLRENYNTPRDAIAAINSAIQRIFELCPIVLIDVTTGKLCDAHERIRVFKSEKAFMKLVSEMLTKKIDDDDHILQAVAQFFKWIMFSHTWEGKEPTFQDVNLVDTIWNLDDSLLNEKLRQFCKTVGADGYRWAWSDTCCIDKSTSAILSQSLTSMYGWYEEAAETLVYLMDVLSSSEVGDLTKSWWMTRAWTLQEFLASKVVRFYNREWQPYLNDKNRNHKESPVIKQELADALKVAPETIASFRPADLGVREKLYLASTRKATVEEDIAYSLIGIFSSDIVPRYGLGKTALGHLLENIVARSGDVTVIAWTGRSLPYNSALPMSLAAYSRNPYTPPPMDAQELDARVEQLRVRWPKENALTLYYQIIQLPRATFWNRCLQLPCIVFSVAKIGIQDNRGRGFLYRAAVSLLGKVDFRTADTMPLTKPRKLIFVHPWFHELLDPRDGFMADESDVESDAGGSYESEGESDTGSGDASVPASPLHPEPLVCADSYTLALRVIARLGRPFSMLLLEQLPNGQYRRVAAENEIIVPGVPHETDFKKGIRVKVLEII